MNKFREAFLGMLGRNISILLLVFILVGIGFVCYSEWQKFSESQQLRWDETRVQMAQLSDNIIVGQAKVLSKEEFKIYTEDVLSKELKKYLKENNMVVLDTLEVLAKNKTNVIRLKEGDVDKRYYSEKNKEWRAYSLKYLWTKPDIDGHAISLGYAQFWTEGELSGRWTVGVLPFKIKAIVSRIQAETGEYTYSVEVVFVGPTNGPDEQKGKEWRVTLDPDDIKVNISTLAANEAKLPKVEIKRKWNWWAPHIHPNIGGGIYVSDQVTGVGIVGIGFSPFGYGKTINDLDWEFASIGIDYLINRDILGFSLAPVSYRFMNKFITNTRWQMVRCGATIESGWYCGSMLAIDF